MGAVLLPIIGLMLTTTLTAIFYIKRHISNNETNIYGKLLLLETIFIIVGLITFIIAKITNSDLLIAICQKIYMSILLFINFYSIKYCLTVSNIKLKTSNLIIKVLLILTIISTIFVLVLPLNVINDGNILDGNGPSYNVTILYSLLSYLIFIILTLIMLFKKENITKIFPFIVLVLLYCIGFMIRTICPELIFEGFFYSYILFIMYHTIENPDMKMVKKLQLSQKQMKKSNQIKSEFLSSMSHEIRTPLNAIVGYSELIEYANSLDEAKQDAKDIVNSSHYLLNMYQNMLDLYKLESNEFVVENKEYDPKKELNIFIDMFMYKITEKKLEIIRKIENMPILIGDISIIKKALINIMDNAIKYTEKGTITIKANFNSKNELVIIVKDTGCGIKKENLNKLFTKFERLDFKDSNINGFGLGLSLSKSLIELISGEIEINSFYGKGTEAKIIIKQEVKNESISC